MSDFPKKTSRDEVRPFVLFLITGGFVTGPVLISFGQYGTGITLSLGCGTAGILLALLARVIDRIDS
jgi:hypothetical protein